MDPSNTHYRFTIHPDKHLSIIATTSQMTDCAWVLCLLGIYRLVTSKVQDGLSKPIRSAKERDQVSLVKPYVDSFSHPIICMGATKQELTLSGIPHYFTITGPSYLAIVVEIDRVVDHTIK
jgi:hypothetical protein